MNPAVVLLSGGIDSSTCVAIAKQQGFAVYAMTFRYGQRHGVELRAAKKVADALGVGELKTVDIDLRTFGGSSLTSDTGVPRNRSLDRDEIPNTYVPARNTIFLSFALGWAEVLGCRDIFIGVNAIDYSGYPDCRPEFISAFEAVANLATKAAVTGSRMKIHAPLINLTKAQTIRLGAGLGLDYGLTHSCYDPDGEGRACGACDSCVIRRRAFTEAGITDPTVYV